MLFVVRQTIRSRCWTLRYMEVVYSLFAFFPSSQVHTVHTVAPIVVSPAFHKPWHTTECWHSCKCNCAYSFAQISFFHAWYFVIVICNFAFFFPLTQVDGIPSSQVVPIVAQKTQDVSTHAHVISFSTLCIYRCFGKQKNVSDSLRRFFRVSFVISLRGINSCLYQCFFFLR